MPPEEHQQGSLLGNVMRALGNALGPDTQKAMAKAANALESAGQGMATLKGVELALGNVQSTYIANSLGTNMNPGTVPNLGTGRSAGRGGVG